MTVDLLLPRLLSWGAAPAPVSSPASAPAEVADALPGTEAPAVPNVLKRLAKALSAAFGRLSAPA